MGEAVGARNRPLSEFREERLLGKRKKKKSAKRETGEKKKRFTLATRHPVDALVVAGALMALGVGYLIWSMPIRGVALVGAAALCAVAAHRGSAMATKRRESRGGGQSVERKGSGK